MRRSKASLIYKKTKNLRAVQILLGHSKLESTVRYLGIEVDDALDIAEQLDVWGIAAAASSASPASGEKPPTFALAMFSQECALLHGADCLPKANSAGCSGCASPLLRFSCRLA